MTRPYGLKPAIALVDDDFHSARLMTRTLEANGVETVVRLSDADEATPAVLRMATQSDPAALMVVVDLKRSSAATRDFIIALRRIAPGLLVVAMSATLDRLARNQLIEAGAAAVFERHADIELYRREAAGIVDFWARSQRPGRTGT